MPHKDIQKNKIIVNGSKINYYKGGEGVPLLIVHGGGDGARTWIKNARALTHRYCVYIPDLPGFGESETISDRFELGAYADFIHNFTEKVGLERFNLIGHSVGGAIAMRYALKHQQQIEGLILVNSMCMGLETSLWIRLFSHKFFCRTMGEMLLKVQNGIKSICRLFHEGFNFANPITRIKIDIGTKMLALGGQTTVLLHELSELITPTLLLWGDRDSIAPVSHAYSALAVIPSCELKIFNGGRHSMYRQRIPEFSQEVIKFLG